MVDDYRTPGVYVAESPALPPGVAEVETAIPAFVGHTERATRSAPNDLAYVPTRIRSLLEYEALFGGPHAEPLEVELRTNASAPGGFEGSLEVADAVPARLLYWAVKLFFDNGGAQCYIVSTGSYADAVTLGDTTTGLTRGLEAVALEDEPTLLAIPEATKLPFADYATLAQRTLTQCGTLEDRFAILDVWGGDRDIDTPIDVGGGRTRKLIDANREAWSAHLQYGAAYYPFLETALHPFVAADRHNVRVILDGHAAVGLDSLATARRDIFNAAQAVIDEHFLTLPPSGAVAGVYAAVDRTRGAWKAPANVSLTNVVAPAVPLDNARQGLLNVDATTGKSINAIRAFPGRGTYVWGARTLAGNDNEWRYVPVRRFVTAVEESVKKATQFAVFERNDAALWTKVRGMIENYLLDKWRGGALAGAAPEEAFYVRCGLGTTMSAQDILAGRLNMEIGLAVVRPAEFIVVRLSHTLARP